MGRQGDCIAIERIDGKRALIPLTVWENGLKLDADWHVYVPSVVAALTAPLKIVELVSKKHGQKKGK